MSKVIVSLSGGMDSATLLFDLLNQGHQVIPVNFSYGSKHGKWEKYATRCLLSYALNTSDWAARLEPLQSIDLTGVFLAIGGSHLLQNGGPIPEGHYEASSMTQTVVPGRNTIFASILGGIAQSRGADLIALGVHAGDHVIYPDCRPEWVDVLGKTIQVATEGKVKVEAPYLHLDKAGILTIGKGLKFPIPYELTRTCYKDQEISCGKCGSCQERLEAFTKIGVPDPIAYESRLLLPK